MRQVLIINESDVNKFPMLEGDFFWSLTRLNGLITLPISAESRMQSEGIEYIIESIIIKTEEI